MNKPRIIGSQSPRDRADATALLREQIGGGALTVVHVGGTPSTRRVRALVTEATPEGPRLREATRLVAVVGRLPYQDAAMSGAAPGAIVLTATQAGGAWATYPEAQIARAVRAALEGAVNADHVVTL